MSIFKGSAREVGFRISHPASERCYIVEFVCQQSSHRPYPPANIERIIRKILVAFPPGKLGRLDVSHVYNTSGAASRRPASMQAVADVRN
jgi:hypothetical protein